jgi:hypothetical protein
MTSELVLLLVAGAALMAVNSWRATLVLCTLIGILQDPLRKLAPDQPVYFVVLVGVVFGAGWLGAFAARVPLRPRAIHGWQSNVGGPFSLFVFIALIQAVHSFALFRSLPITGIGLLSYFSAVPAIVLAYQYAVRFGVPGIHRWMLAYIVLASLALVGIYLEYVGMGWVTLGQVGEGLIIYDVGRALKAYAGFFRAAEIAAWHTVTIVACVAMLLVAKRRALPSLVVGSAFAIAVIGMGTLTGRRKLLVQIIVFAFAYFGLFALFQRHSRKLAGVVAVAGVTAYLVIGSLGPDDRGERVYASQELRVEADEIYQAYVLRARSVVKDVGDRVSGLGFEPVAWAYNRAGFFGAGLGAGSQGAQHFGADSFINRAAAEGGLGKIMLEVGVPGFIVIAWLFLAMVRFARRNLEYLAATSPAHARLGYGLAAFLIANAATFSMSAQAYGDVFILMCLGWATGFLLALPVLAARATEANRRPVWTAATPIGGLIGVRPRLVQS